LNLSILDGWWREGYDGTNGFAIGDDSHPSSIEEQDRLDSENLFKALTAAGDSDLLRSRLRAASRRSGSR
jgi:glucan phosphorylase